jgi:hypothetical protein
VLLLRFKFWAPQQRGIAKHPQILTCCALRSETVKQSALEDKWLFSCWRIRGISRALVGHLQACPFTIRPPFSEKTNMSNNQDENQPVVLAILVGVIVLVIGLAVGIGIAKSKKAAPAAPAAVTAPAAPAPAAAADAAAAAAAPAAPAAPAAADAPAANTAAPAAK